jgi:hypothetical protein
MTKGESPLSQVLLLRRFEGGEELLLGEDTI